MKPRDVVFIDELHALPRPVSEALYEAMDHFRLKVPILVGSTTVTFVIEVAPFTLVGATTEAGELAEPFTSRFRIREEIDLYAPEPLAAIVRRAAEAKAVPIEPEAAVAVAQAARGTPRQALSLLCRLQDEAIVADVKRIDLSLVEKTLASMEVDAQGLGPTDRRILEAVRTRPMGPRRLAATARVNPRTYFRYHEPFLLQKGFLEVTPRGRIATRSAVSDRAP